LRSYGSISRGFPRGDKIKRIKRTTWKYRLIKKTRIFYKNKVSMGSWKVANNKREATRKQRK
jgi:hypothetical protein